MRVIRVTFYKTNNLKEEFGELKLCRVILDCGITINDIVLWESLKGELKIMLPKRKIKRYNSDEITNYSIVRLNDEMYDMIKQEIIKQWECYSKNWEEVS